MLNLDPAENKASRAWKRRILPLSLLAAGVILATIQWLCNAGSYVKALFVRVEHPASFRFSRYDALLKEHVAGNLVDFRRLADKRAQLAAAVDELAHISPDRFSDHDVLCFWINAYNLLVLEDIIEHYPVRSVKELGNAFSLHEFVVGGKLYSAERIEQTEIRPRLARSRNAMPLFTICGGARGYPPLLDHALAPASLDKDANEACSNFVNDLRNARFDWETNTFVLSPFFKWNESLLTINYRTPFAFANAFLPAEKQADLDNKHIKTSFLVGFDWRLNDTALRALPRNKQSDEANSHKDQAGNQQK